MYVLRTTPTQPTWLLLQPTEQALFLLGTNSALGLKSQPLKAAQHVTMSLPLQIRQVHNFHVLKFWIWKVVQAGTGKRLTAVRRAHLAE